MVLWNGGVNVVDTIVRRKQKPIRVASVAGPNFVVVVVAVVDVDAVRDWECQVVAIITGGSADRRRSCGSSKSLYVCTHRERIVGQGLAKKRDTMSGRLFVCLELLLLLPERPLIDDLGLIQSVWLRRSVRSHQTCRVTMGSETVPQSTNSRPRRALCLLLSLSLSLSRSLKASVPIRAATLLTTQGNRDLACSSVLPSFGFSVCDQKVPEG